MADNNLIGIVGVLTEDPKITLDAKNWKKKIFETMITADRRSGRVDTLILEIPAAAAGSEEEMKKLTAGTEVLVIGEINTKDINTQDPTEQRVKVFIKALTITKNDPSANRQNNVIIKGNLCKDPRSRKTPRGTAVTEIMVATNFKNESHYIPCVCWQNVAEAAAGLQKGDYVEIEGRFQSREYKKQMPDGVAFLMTAYEVSVASLGMQGEEIEEEGEQEA